MRDEDGFWTLVGVVVGTFLFPLMLLALMHVWTTVP